MQHPLLFSRLFNWSFHLLIFYIVYYFCCHVSPHLYCQDKSYWVIMCNPFFIDYCVWFSSILLEIFAFIFINCIDNNFLVMSLSGFSVRVSKNWASQVAASGKEPTCQCRRHKRWQVRSQGQEDPLEKRLATHSNILAWRMPMDRGTWQAIVHWVAKSQTWLKWLSTHVRTSKNELGDVSCPPIWC